MHEETRHNAAPNCVGRFLGDASPRPLSARGGPTLKAANSITPTDKASAPAAPVTLITTRIQLNIGEWTVVERDGLILQERRKHGHGLRLTTTH